jgi:hypothetical protein
MNPREEETMKVGDLVKYQENCDATGWVGLIVETRKDRAKVSWPKMGWVGWTHTGTLKVLNESR